MGNLKSFRQFLESTVKGITVTFGRFQPPTIGHEKLLNAVASEAGGETYRIYASQTQDSDKNPLQYSEKIKILRQMFPKYSRNIIEDTSIRTVFDVASKAYDDGFTQFRLVVGQDRDKEFSRLLQKYEGTKLQSGGYYSFPSGIEVISAGNRDPDADDVEGMSASKMRQAVRDEDLRAFSQGLPSNYDNAQGLFNLLRKRMGLKEINNFREDVQLAPLSSVRESYVKGEIFNVGDSVRLKNGAVTQIIQRGANYLVTSGDQRHWLTDIQAISEGWASDAYKAIGGKGLRYLDRYGDTEAELVKTKEIQNGLQNMDKLDPKYKAAFKIFKNLDGQVVFQETDYIPHFHLI